MLVTSCWLTAEDRLCPATAKPPAPINNWLLLLTADCWLLMHAAASRMWLAAASWCHWCLLHHPGCWLPPSAAPDAACFLLIADCYSPLLWATGSKTDNIKNASPKHLSCWGFAHAFKHQDVKLPTPFFHKLRPRLIKTTNDALNGILSGHCSDLLVTFTVYWLNLLQLSVSPFWCGLILHPYYKSGLICKTCGW